MTTDVAETEILPEVQDTSPSTELDNLIAEELDAVTETEIETEIPETPAEPEPAPPAAPRSPQELQAAVNAGEILTTEEKTRLREHDRAEQNRQYAVQQARAQQKQRDTALKEKLEGFAPKINERVTAEIKAAIENNRNIIPELLDVRIKEATNELLTDIEPLVTMPHEAAIKAELWREVSEIGGNAAALLQFMDDNHSDFNSKYKFYGEVMKQIGQKTSVDGAELTSLRSENSALKAEVERLASTKGKGTITAQGKGSTSASLSQSEIEARLLDPSTPTEEISKLLAL